MTDFSLRKFPYPYQAMFAIANDIDNTPSLEIFLEMMKLLNTTNNTRLGKGFGLEIGSSFWFFNATHQNQLSYFTGTTNQETQSAPIFRKLWNSGHLDSMHTYGNFDNGGFQRKYAEIALEELEKYGGKIRSWINHGNINNHQNLGLFESQKGAHPNTPAYHFDLLKNYGVRYIWQGLMTHILGQTSRPTVNILTKNMLQKLLSVTKYKKLPIKPFDLKNRLMREIQLQDSNYIWDYQRFVNNWGAERILHIYDLARQIKPANIDRIIKNEGFSIIYTHMCEALNSFSDFPHTLHNDFHYIAKQFRAKKLLVSTSARLLQYFEISNYLIWHIENIKDYKIIKIAPFIKTLNQKMTIDENHLQGITFYCSTPSKVKILLEQKELKIKINPKDQTGQPSVSIPWKKLEYPYRENL